MNKYRSIIICVAMTLAVVQAAISQTPTWKASIVSVSSELPEYITGIESRKTPGQTDSDWPGRPAGHRWVNLTVQLTSPSRDAKVAVSNIRITDKDGSYTAMAVSYQVKPKDSIVYLPLVTLSPPHADTGIKETVKGASPKAGGGWSTLYNFSPDRKSFDPVSVGFFEKMDIKKMLFNVLLKGASGGRELQLAKSPLNLVLLFAVPDGASDLQLKVGDAEAVSVPGMP